VRSRPQRKPPYDPLWLLTGFDSFDLLYTGRALSADEVARTLIMAAEHSLCR
jgi:hypothetical protein